MEKRSKGGGGEAYIDEGRIGSSMSWDRHVCGSLWDVEIEAETVLGRRGHVRWCGVPF
jgi:hypothetical protein